MQRSLVFGAIVFTLAVGLCGSATAQTLVLPLRTIGVNDTTATVVGDLLAGELESRGMVMLATSRLNDDFRRAGAACDDPECAAAIAANHGASQVVYGSLSRLGDKIIFRIRALRAGETTPFYMDQLTATSIEDLDTVVRRAADGLAAGRSSADRATVDTVTQLETLEPRRRANRRGVGLRAGFLFPVDDSYGGNDRLTSLRLAFKYESRNYFIESTPFLGFSWSGSTVEWTILDLFGARIFGGSDLASYAGVGLGVHSLNVERRVNIVTPYSYETSSQDSETTLTTDVGVGFIALRTYDLSIIVDLRYHFVFSSFGLAGGRGAHGFALRFGTSR